MVPVKAHGGRVDSNGHLRGDSDSSDGLRRNSAAMREFNSGMRPLVSTASALVAACLISACGTTRTIMVGQARPAISPGAVRVYEAPPRHYERIAIINSSGGTSWIFSDRGSMETAIARLCEEAAALGANGVLLQQVYDEPAGGLSIGIGGFGFGGGRHHFYGGGGAADVGGPLINHRVQATAIYVR
jgi:hypothetical protein